MKSPILLCLALAGCQTAAPLPGLPVPAKPVMESRPVAAAPTLPANPALEQKVHLQAQYIEALLSQNDALIAKLATAVGTPSMPVAAAPAFEPAPKPAPVLLPAQAVPTEPTLAPNADGVIDLAAATADAKPGEPVNPFAVRTASTEAVWEVTLQVAGIMAGATPCAVINDRMVQAGDSVESFTVERIEPDALWLRYAGRRLRLPVSEKPARVRLPL